MPRDIAELKSETRAAGLTYVNPDDPGISRRRGEGFSYLDAKGAPVKDETTLARIQVLGARGGPVIGRFAFGITDVKLAV